ncbi:acetoacetate metabolism regulatory protein atoc [hydrocarbon metagenome]|uniref:HTH-type transcriptional regulatory protein TyrR n=1 Tax=hydrocarbon metagenome TaxID=938273 RepID=A0A0W8E4R5_9ZZZZ
MLCAIDFRDATYPTFTPDVPAYEALDILTDVQESIGFVVQDGKYMGTFRVTSNKIKQLSATTLVGDIVIRNYPTILPDTLIYQLGLKSLHPVPLVSKQGFFYGVIQPATVFSFYQMFTTTQYGEVQNHLSVGVVFESAEGLITQINASAIKLLGVEIKDVLFQPLTQVIPEVKLGETYKTRINIQRHGKIIDLKRNFVELKGRQIGCMTVLADISSLVNVTAELSGFHNLTEEIETIFRYASEGLCIINNNGVILKGNQALCQVMGASQDHIENRHVKELKMDGIIDKSIAEAVLAKKAEVTITQRSKQQNQWLTTGRPVFDKDGNILYVVSTARDVIKTNRMYRAAGVKRDKYTFLDTDTKDILDKVGIIGESKSMANIISVVSRIANSSVTVLIQGESGTGKELIAKLIHEFSDRRFKGTFVSVNCGALPRELLEAELFGYVGGSFTGSKKEGKKGLFELANKGTIFLDEIGDMPFDLQVKLLKAVEYGEIAKVGSAETIKVDARIIAATNQNLQSMVADGTFREDLFYRLNVIPIVLPPLRERREEIVILYAHFIEMFNKKYHANKEFSVEAQDILQNYKWPGNIREMKNLVERLVLTTEADIIGEEDLPAQILETREVFERESECSLRQAMENVERRIILDAYNRYGSTYKVAEALDISQTSVVRKLNKYLPTNV